MKFSRSNTGTGGVGDLETTELDRRSADSVKHNGKIKEVDYKSKPPKYRVEFGKESDEDNYILTDWLPASGGRAQGDVTTHFLEVGERVSVHSEGGELSTGRVHPAGGYTKDDERKPGTDKPGVMHYRFKNGQEFSIDRETGSLKFVGKGKKKEDSTSGSGSSSGSGSGSSGSSTGGGQEIKGDVSFEAADGTFTMKDGVLTGTMGDKASFKLSKDKLETKIGDATHTMTKDGHEWKFGSVTMKISGAGLEVTGGDVKHNGKPIGSEHKHTDVMPGGGLTGFPQA